MSLKTNDLRLRESGVKLENSHSKYKVNLVNHLIEEKYETFVFSFGLESFIFTLWHFLCITFIIQTINVIGKCYFIYEEKMMHHCSMKSAFTVNLFVVVLRSFFTIENYSIYCLVLISSSHIISLRF